MGTTTNEVNAKIPRIVVYLGWQIMGAPAFGNVSSAGLDEEETIVGPVRVSSASVRVGRK